MERQAPTDDLFAGLDIDESLAFRLILLVNLMSRPFHAIYGRREDITLGEWRVVVTLAAHPDSSAAEVCHMTGMHKMNVSRAVRRLVRMGRVAWSNDPADGRRKILRLTERGQALYGRMARTARWREELLTAALSPAEKDVFRRLLDQVIASARRWADQPEDGTAKP